MRQKKIFIMLGRIGDVINILPAIEYEAKQNNYTPKMVVAKEYAGVLDGCSYVDPIIHDGDFRHINTALRTTRRNFPQEEIINCAVYGQDYPFKRECNSFLRDAWRQTKCPIRYGRLKLNFDMRDKNREKKVINELVKNKKPIVITALSGYSAPFYYAAELSDYLRSLKDFNVVDISNYRAEKFYDLLGLYEKAHCIVAIDSGPLHLAEATDIPVIAIRRKDLPHYDKWLGSDWKPNQVMRTPYPDVLLQLDKIKSAIIQPTPKKRIHFITSSKIETEMDPDTRRRNEFAKVTREEENNYSRGLYRFYNYNKYKRKSSEGMPYVKDMIDFIYKKANDEDVLMVCNSDISFTPGITGWILDTAGESGAAYFHRWDFHRLDRVLKDESELTKGKWYDGSDTFVFTKKWWTEHRDIFPDMIFGREHWDNIFRNMIKRTGGAEIHSGTYHEKHNGFWEQNKYENPGNIYNARLAHEWWGKYGGSTFDWKFGPEKWREIYK